jgi:hypothetical protein
MASAAHCFTNGLLRLSLLRSSLARVVSTSATQARGGGPTAAAAPFSSHYWNLTMHMNKIYHRLIDLGEEAAKVAVVLHKERDHNLHRAYVACREFSEQLAQALTALAPAARESMLDDK